MRSTPKRGGLGRGLGALLGDAPARDSEPAANHGQAVRDIPVERVRPNPQQPRKTFRTETLDELKTSIEEHGVLVPILVRERDGWFELIAGERRWRACAALQQSTIPAIVRASDDRASLEMAIIENLQRENLNALEESAGIAQLIEAHGFTQEQIARRLGKSRPAIANALRLLTLPQAITAMIVDGRLSAGHAKALLAAPQAARLELAARAASQGLSVRALERVAAALSAEPAVKPARAERAVSAEDGEFETNLRERVGAAVALRRSGRGGSIEIRFSSEPELIRIAEILLGR